jgi:hypothetical protein
VFSASGRVTRRYIGPRLETTQKKIRRTIETLRVEVRSEKAINKMPMTSLVLFILYLRSFTFPTVVEKSEGLSIQYYPSTVSKVLLEFIPPLPVDQSSIEELLEKRTSSRFLARIYQRHY